MTSKVFLAAAAVSLLLAASACSQGTTGTAGRTSPAPGAQPATGTPAASLPAGTARFAVAEVNASGMGGAFNPPTLTVHVGDAVEWTNSSGNIHNVTFEDARHSPVMFAGEKWSQAFPKAGTFKYVCTYHPGMDGTIVVS